MGGDYLRLAERDTSRFREQWRRIGMFLALLKFSKGKNRAGELMAAHNAWIERGFDDGVFLVVGSLQPGLGGIVVVDKVARDELEKRLESDPFVVHDVVKVELLEVLPSKTDPRLRFLSS